MPGLNAGPNARLNGPSNRVRNTATEVAGKNKGGIPGVPGKVGVPGVPSFGESYGSVPGATASLASAYAGFQQVAAAMRAQRVGLRAGFKSKKADIRAEGISAMSDTINSGIDRGITGSSAVSQERIGVIAGVKTGIEGARGEMKQGVLESKVQEQQAYLQYDIAQQQMAAQAAAARQQAEIASAAAAATASGQADLFSYLKGLTDQGSQVPVAKSIGGVVFEPTKGGGYRAPGIGFVPAGTPMPVLMRMIREQKAKTAGFIGSRVDTGRM
jgi:hypothetical protein